VAYIAEEHTFMTPKIEAARKLLEDAREIRESKANRGIAIGLLSQCKAMLEAENIQYLASNEQEVCRTILFEACVELGQLYDLDNRNMDAVKCFDTALSLEDDLSIRERRAFLLGIEHRSAYKEEYENLLQTSIVKLEFWKNYIFCLEINDEHEAALCQFKALISHDLSKNDQEEILRFPSAIQEVTYADGDLVDEYRKLIIERYPHLSTDTALVRSSIRDITQYEEVAPEVGIFEIGKVAAERVSRQAKLHPIPFTVTLIVLGFLLYPYFVIHLSNAYIISLNITYGGLGILLMIAYFLNRSRRKAITLSILVLSFAHSVTVFLIASGTDRKTEELIYWWVLLIYIIALPTILFRYFISTADFINDAIGQAVVQRRIIYRFLMNNSTYVLFFLFYINVVVFPSLLGEGLLDRLGFLFDILFVISAFFYVYFAKRYWFRRLREDLLIIAILAYVLSFITYFFAGMDIGIIIRDHILETMVLMWLIFSKLYILEGQVIAPRAAPWVLFTILLFQFVTLLTTYHFPLDWVRTVKLYYEQILLVTDTVIALISLFWVLRQRLQKGGSPASGTGSERSADS
jgi:hypothetical protein